MRLKKGGASTAPTMSLNFCRGAACRTLSVKYPELNALSLGFEPLDFELYQTTGLSLVRFVNGKIAEAWTNRDTLGMMQQLGFIPTPVQ